MENKYFEIAIKEAKKAYNKGEIPVGAIIVKDGKILAKSHNNRQKNYNPLGHAEINCIIKAAKINKDWRLDQGFEMYVTLEPCEMCKTIINECRLKKVVYLCEQKNTSNKNSNVFKQTNVCLKQKLIYENLLKEFFNKLRD